LSQVVENKFQDCVGKDEKVNEHNITRKNTLLLFTGPPYLFNGKEEVPPLSVIPKK